LCGRYVVAAISGNLDIAPATAIVGICRINTTSGKQRQSEGRSPAQTLNQRVIGSSPMRGTRETPYQFVKSRTCLLKVAVFAGVSTVSASSWLGTAAAAGRSGRRGSHGLPRVLSCCCEL